MEAMVALTAEDLRQIRGVMDESIARHPRFYELERKIEMAMDDVLVVVQEGFGMIGERFEAVDRRFDGMDQRFDGLEADVKELKGDMVVVRHMVKDHAFRIGRLEHKTGLL